MTTPEFLRSSRVGARGAVRERSPQKTGSPKKNEPRMGITSEGVVLTRSSMNARAMDAIARTRIRKRDHCNSLEAASKEPSP